MTQKKIIPKRSENDLSLENFIQFFPEVTLPYTLSTESQRMFSLDNEPLSIAWIDRFALLDEEELDPFTEFMPCFKLPTSKYLAIVYWKANISGSSFHVVTMDLKGRRIDQKNIAGLTYNTKGMMQKVCTIGTDLMISMVEGRVDEKGHSIPVDPAHTHLQSYLKINNDGKIESQS